MPRVSVRSLNQTAVLWAVTSYADEFGQRVVQADYPIEIKVRWERTHRDLNGLYKSKDKLSGDSIEADAVVITSIDIPIGSKLWLGTLDNNNAMDSDADYDDVMEVKMELTSPDVKGRVYRRMYGLMRTKDSNP